MHPHHYYVFGSVRHFFSPSLLRIGDCANPNPFSTETPKSLRVWSLFIETNTTLRLGRFRDGFDGIYFRVTLNRLVSLLVLYFRVTSENLILIHILPGLPYTRGAPTIWPSLMLVYYLLHHHTTHAAVLLTLHTTINLYFIIILWLTMSSIHSSIPSHTQQPTHSYYSYCICSLASYMAIYLLATPIHSQPTYHMAKSLILVY